MSYFTPKAFVTFFPNRCHCSINNKFIIGNGFGKFVTFNLYQGYKYRVPTLEPKFRVLEPLIISIREDKEIEH